MATEEREVFYEDEILGGLAMDDYLTMKDATVSPEKRRAAEGRFFESIRLMHESSKIGAELTKLELERERFDKNLELEREKLKHEAEIEKGKAKTEKIKTIAKVATTGGAIAAGGLIAYAGYKVNLDGVDTMAPVTSTGKSLVFNTLLKTF